MIVKTVQNLDRTLYLAFLWLGLAVSSFGQPVVINEIMFHPLQPPLAAEPLGQEFIELYNRSGTNVNLSGWHFRKGVSFTFTNRTLAAGAFLVISPNLAQFAATYPGVTNAVGPGTALWETMAKPSS